MASRKEYELLFKLQAALGGNFNSAFSSALNTTTKLQNNLQKLNSTIGKVDSYKKQESALETNRKKLEKLTAEHDKLQKEINETEGPTDALREKLARNEKQIQETTSKIEDQENRLKSLGKELSDAGVDTSHLTEENERLAKSYEKIKAGQEQLANINAAIQKNNEAISKTKTQLAGTIGTIAALGTAIYAGPVKKAAEFESQMSSVKAIIANSYGDNLDALATDMERLNEIAKTMGATTQYTATESGKALEYMGMAGWKADQMIAGLPGIMNLAAASGEDLATVSDIVTDALTALGMTADDTNRFVDILAATATSSNTNVSGLGEAFKYVAATAGTLGYSAEDLSIALGVMANAGIKGSQAGNSLKTALSRMAAPTTAIKNAMDSLGISMTDDAGNTKSLMAVMNDLRSSIGTVGVDLVDAEGNLREYEDIISDLSKTTEGLSQVQQIEAASTIFGKNAMAGMLAIVNATDTDFQSLADSIYNSADAAEAMAGIKLDNLEGNVTLLKSAVDALQIAIGDALLPTFTEGAKKATELISKATEFINKNPELVQQIVKITAGLLGAKAAALTAKLGFLNLKGGILSLKKAFASIKAAGGLKEILSSIGGIKGKILPIIAVIGAVAVAIKLISGNLEEVRGWIQNTFGDGALAVFDKVWGVIQNVGNAIKGIFSGENIGNARNFFEDHFGAAGVAVFDALIGVVEQLKATLPGLLDQFGRLATTLLPVIGNLIRTLLPLIGQIVATVLPVLFNLIAQIIPVIGQIVEAILPILIQLIETLVPIVMQIIEAVLPVLQQLLEALAPLFTQIIESILPVVINLISLVVSAIQPLVEAILPLLQSLLQALMPVIQAVAQVFSGVLGAAITAISGIIEGLSKVLNGIITFITGVFTGNWQQAWDGVKSIFSGIWETILSVCKGVVNGIISVINGIIGGLNKLKIPDWVPVIGGQGVNIPLIPTLAKGSNYTPDTFIAGEAGAELITNARGRKVFTAAQTGQIFDNINAAQRAQESATIVAIAPALQAALAARESVGVTAGTVTAPGISAGAMQRQTSVVIHSQPVFHVGSEAEAEDIEEVLRQHDEQLMQEFDDRLRGKEEDERRTTYD